ncbi:MAG: hypothetical protein ACRC6V_10430 [Bacteroidales bacterium]
MTAMPMATHTTQMTNQAGQKTSIRILALTRNLLDLMSSKASFQTAMQPDPTSVHMKITNIALESSLITYQPSGDESTSSSRKQHSE